MTITLKPETEQLVRDAIRQWRFESVDELITKTLEAWNERNAIQRPSRRTPAEAAAHIRQLREGLTLGGLKIKDLINEGRR
jgi:hypothetical protein